MYGIHVTDDTVVDAVLGSNKLVLVGFFSPLSEKCNDVFKAMEAFAEKHKDKVDILYANIDVCPKLVELFGVQELPSVVSVKGEDPLWGFRGVPTMEALQILLDRSLQSLARHHINKGTNPGPRPPGP